MWMSILFGTKFIEFFEIDGMFTQTREVEPVRIFCRLGGQFFAIFYG